MWQNKLKEIIPDINIIFVTGYDEYTKDAMAKIHASGYIEKPSNGWESQKSRRKIFAIHCRLKMNQD